MSGEKLKILICKLTGKNLAEIARRMGQSPQALNSKLNANDVKSGVIEEMSKKLNVPISKIYDCEEIEKNPSDDSDDVPFFVYKELLDRYESALQEIENLRMRLSAYEQVEKSKNVG